MATSKGPSSPARRSDPRTAASPRSATARAAASRSSPPAACSLTPPSTATAPSSSAPRPRARRSRSGPSTIWRRTSPARCSACSVPTTSTPRPREVAELEEALKQAGKTYEFHSYEGAGHAFFATDRPSYRPEAANDGWRADLDVLRALPGRGVRTARVHLPAPRSLSSPGRAKARRGGSRFRMPRVYFDHPGALSRRAQLEHRLSRTWTAPRRRGSPWSSTPPSAGELALRILEASATEPVDSRYRALGTRALSPISCRRRCRCRCSCSKPRRSRRRGPPSQSRSGGGRSRRLGRGPVSRARSKGRRRRPVAAAEGSDPDPADVEARSGVTVALWRSPAATGSAVELPEGDLDVVEGTERSEPCMGGCGG